MLRTKELIRKTSKTIISLVQGVKEILKSVLSIECDFFKNAIFLIAFTDFIILFHN